MFQKLKQKIAEREQAQSFTSMYDKVLTGPANAEPRTIKVEHITPDREKLVRRLASDGANHGSVLLIPEPNNPDIPNAVRVFIETKHIGYLPSERDWTPTEATAEIIGDDEGPWEIILHEK